MTIEPVALVNGIRDGRVSAFDRGLAYGDGVFRTLRVCAGKPLWLDDHLAKLSADAGRLGIPIPDAGLWRSDLQEAMQGAPADAVLKLILTRGPGQRGYLPAAAPEITRIVMLSPLGPQPEDGQGANLRVCRLRLGEQPTLAGIKHLNRLENVLARMEWSDPGIDEGVLLDAAGRVICGVSSNLFIYRRGVLATPDLHRCGVAGVTRQRLLERAGRLKLRVEVADISLDDLHAAEEIMIANSLIGLRHVARLGERVWAAPSLCPQLRALLDD